MRRLIPLLLALCLLLSGCDLLAERSYGRLTWEADTLLVFRYDSRETLIVEDQQTITALRDSFAWQDAHLECCAEDADFSVIAYLNGERVYAFYGYDDQRAGSYNRETMEQLYALGQAETNGSMIGVRVPGGMLPEDVAALLPGARVLPIWPEDTAWPRSTTLRASYTMPFAASEEITDEWRTDAPLGAFASDDVFLPLRDALEKEGVLRYAGEVWSPTARYSPEQGDSYCRREVVFYLTAAPSFTGWAGLEVAVEESRGWYAWLVTDAPLDDAQQAALTEQGLQTMYIN